METTKFWQEIPTCFNNTTTLWARPKTTRCSRNSHTVKSKSCIQKVFVVRNLRNNLLGLPAIKHLQMLPQLDTIQKVIPDQFPGLGTMKEMYTIKMKPNAKPYALYIPRNVPLPLRAKVQTELTRMENMGVISKVETRPH